MNPLGSLASCFKGKAAPEESHSEEESHIESDFELDSVDSDEDVPPPSHIPPPPPQVILGAGALPAPTPESLQADLKTEMCYWSTKYKNDETFRKNIDAYVEFRKQVMEIKDLGVTSENPDEDPLEPLYQQLGSKLAEAFGMVDPETKDWTREVKNAAKNGGAEYARPSIKAFMWTQSPTIFKSTVNLYTRIFLGDEIASKVRHATNFAYPFMQAAFSVWAAQNNGYEQSEAVQLQKRANPEWCPNVESSTIINEDGTIGELRAMRHVLEDLGQLREVDALIKERDPAKLEQKRKQLVGQRLLAKAKLEEQLTLVTKALGKSQESGDSPPLNDIEKKILNIIEGKKFTLEERIDELSQVTTGRAALSGLARLEAKRLLRQLADWRMLSEELSTAIEAVEGGVPYESTAVRKAVVDTDFERAKVARYVMLNVLSHQAIVRDIRTAFYGGATVTQLSLQLAEYFTGYEGTVAGDALQVITSLVQTLYYAWEYPDATGKDALNKFATQWQIIAMTGAGNLIGKDGEFDAAKLDKMVTGKLNTRLAAFGSLLRFDQTVYGQAVLGWLVDPRTVDNDEADKAKFGGKNIPCTYAVLADGFSKLKTPADRAAFIDAIAVERQLAEGVRERIDRNLQLYEESAANSANKGDASRLLGEDSTLPQAAQNVLRGSLEQVADSGDATSENDELDRELFKLAGKIEQRGELPSQAAQKLGQAFAWFVGGTSGFLVLKSIFTLGAQALILRGELTEGGAEELAGAILGGKIFGNAVALAGLVFQLGFNHGYQDYIARKALLRQNAGGGVSIVNAPPPSLRGSLWQEFMVSVGFEDARVEEITGYETLVSKPIPKEDWPPKLKFLRRAKLTEAMWDQMFAVDVRSSWLKNFFEKHGTLEGKTEDELEEAISENLAAIRKLRASPDGTGPADDAKPEATGSDDVRMQIDDIGPTHIVPILDLGSVKGIANAGPDPDDEQRKPLSPRSFRAKRIDELKTAAARKEGPLAKPRSALARTTGESRIERSVIRDPDHLARIDDDEQDPYDELIDLLSGLSSQEPGIRKPSQLMKELPWARSPLGIHVAQTGPSVFYLSPDPSGHASPLQAFSIPDPNRQGLLHISDYKYPSLAVCNMLQASLSGNTNWGTLTTEDEFARFSYQHLSYGPAGLAEMPMQDLAAFTRHMALNEPEAEWIPLTTATVRYAPDARNRIQPVGTPPPELQQGKSFGVSYAAQDDVGATIHGSVMLCYDGQQYSVIDPRSSRPVDSLLNDPIAALKWFMGEIGSEHPNFQERMTFTVLYHVPRATPSNNEYRFRIAEAGGRADVLVESWLQRTASIAEARLQVAEACRSFEEEISYQLTVGATLVVGDKRPIASRVKANLDAIDLLNRVYLSMTRKEMEMEMDLLMAED